MCDSWTSHNNSNLVPQLLLFGGLSLDYSLNYFLSFLLRRPLSSHVVCCDFLRGCWAVSFVPASSLVTIQALLRSSSIHWVRLHPARKNFLLRAVQGFWNVHVDVQSMSIVTEVNWSNKFLSLCSFNRESWVFWVCPAHTAVLFSAYMYQNALRVSSSL